MPGSSCRVGRGVPGSALRAVRGQAPRRAHRLQLVPRLRPRAPYAFLEMPAHERIGFACGRVNAASFLHEEHSNAHPDARRFRTAGPNRAKHGVGSPAQAWTRRQAGVSQWRQRRIKSQNLRRIATSSEVSSSEVGVDGPATEICFSICSAAPIMRVSFLDACSTCSAGSRPRCRGAMRPGYAGVVKRRETRGLRSPRGGCEPPRHACEARHLPLRSRRCASRRSTAVSFALSGRACVLPADKLAASRSASSSRTGHSARRAESEGPGPPASEAGFAGTASCSTCGTTGRRPSASRTGWIYVMAELISRTK